MSRESIKAKRKKSEKTLSKELRSRTGRDNRKGAVREGTYSKATQERKITSSKVKTEGHQLSLSFVRTPLDQVEAGAEMKLQLRVVCSQGCELKGASLSITNGDQVLLNHIELYKYGETANYTSKFNLQAPIAHGKYTWAVDLTPNVQDPLHKECQIPFIFSVIPHSTSIAVWDIPSPIEVGTAFKIKAGLHCLTGCSLGGKEVEVYDQDEKKVATGKLSTSLYSDEIKLYWADLELKAPALAGNYDWQARFHDPSLEMPHQAARHTFGFSTVKPAECELAVQVINKETSAPIKQAEVTCHPNLYHSITDENGVARIALARGEYKLTVFASERAPQGIKYTFQGNYSGHPFTTDGRESIIYVPEDNKDAMVPFQAMIEVKSDTAITVELVGVIVPLIKDTM